MKNMGTGDIGPTLLKSLTQPWKDTLRLEKV